jgi:hypothetical protein
MSGTQTQTVSGTMPAVTREGQDVLLNWEARASVQDGKQTVHLRAWSTYVDDNPVQVYQFFGKIVSPQLGDSGSFSSPLNVSVFDADLATFDVPQPVDVGLQIAMRLSPETNRDQESAIPEISILRVSEDTPFSGGNNASSRLAWRR